MTSAGMVRALLLVIAFVTSGCGSDPGAAAASDAAPAAASDPAVPSASSGPTAVTAPSLLGDRLLAIDQAIARWQSAADLATLDAAAEEVRNLVVGPDGPAYGDSDGDGTIGGASEAGLLPGLGGQAGLATESDGVCVVRDVLGGSWADPAARWATLDEAIRDWSPSNNTFPALPSHPQRIVGWSTLALDTGDLATALEHGGHARLHIDISMRAVTDCR